MRKNVILIFISVLTFNIVQSQVFPGTPVSGFPIGTTAQINAITNPVTATIAFSTDERIFYYYDGPIGILLIVQTIPSEI
ncbi:hypothetical protein ACOSP6_01125 [Tenacibaculum sp. MEBiC06402]|uniref:hypothetical protein n=1 Tax=unclassified Tenacibaculum TaxID=2635139 RepID=UPI003B9CA760